MAEREGFEPSVPILFGTHDFQSCPFGLSGISPTLSVSSLNQLQPLSNNSALSAFAEREGCARSLRSLRLPSVAEPSVPILFGTHDFQSCPFGQLGHLSGLLTLCAQRQALSVSYWWCMAEGVGFEPTSRFTGSGFQDRRLKPLGHPSALNSSWEFLVRSSE